MGTENSLWNSSSYLYGDVYPKEVHRLTCEWMLIFRFFIVPLLFEITMVSIHEKLTFIFFPHH